MMPTDNTTLSRHQLLILWDDFVNELFIKNCVLGPALHAFRATLDRVPTPELRRYFHGATPPDSIPEVHLIVLTKKDVGIFDMLSMRGMKLMFEGTTRSANLMQLLDWYTHQDA